MLRSMTTRKSYCSVCVSRLRHRVEDSGGGAIDFVCPTCLNVDHITTMDERLFEWTPSHWVRVSTHVRQDEGDIDDYLAEYVPLACSVG